MSSERLLLVFDPNTQHRLLELAINGLQSTDEVKIIQSQRICSQCQALDMLTWIIAEWKSNVHAPDLREYTRDLIGLFVNNFAALVPHILRSAYVTATNRTLSHKWTILLLDIVHCADWDPMLTQIACQILSTLLKGLTQLVEELHQVKRAASMHWLFVLAGEAIKESTIRPLSAQQEDLSTSAHHLMEVCVEVLSRVGQNWKKQWTNSFHCKLARDYQLSGFIFEQTMFDFPVKILSVKSTATSGKNVQSIQSAPRSTLSKQKSTKNLHQSQINAEQQAGIDWNMTQGMQPTTKYQSQVQPPTWATGHIPSGGVTVQLQAIPAQMIPGMPPIPLAPPSYSYIPPPNFGGIGSGNYAIFNGQFQMLTNAADTLVGHPSGPMSNEMMQYQQMQWSNPLALTSGGIYTAYGTLIPPPSESTNFPPYTSYLQPIGYSNTSIMPPHAKKSGQPANIIAPVTCSDTPQATATICPENIIDEMAWLEMFSIDEPLFWTNNSNKNGRQQTEVMKQHSYNTSNDMINSMNIDELMPPTDPWGSSVENSTWSDLHNSWKAYGYDSWQQHAKTISNNTSTKDTTGKLQEQRLILFNQMPGLLEVSRLHFKCLYGTDHIRIVNEQSKESFALPTCQPNQTINESKNRQRQDAVNKLTDVYSLKQQLQYQQYRLKTVQSQQQNTTSCVEGLGNVEIKPADAFSAAASTAIDTLFTKTANSTDAISAVTNQSDTVISQPHSGSNTPALGGGASSASTFGVPTTPKTTPFQLTPTPLSPISSSETDLNDLGQFGDGNINGEKEEKIPLIENKEEQIMPDQEHFPKKSAKDQVSMKMASRRLFQSPIRYSLAIERMTPGAKKFVVLDFGCTLLLSDLIIPATEYMNMLSVDAWQTEEAIDGQSVAYTTEIGSKSLMLSDIQPPVICRYVKLTYVVRQLYQETCTIPLGQFFGTQFISPWQINLSKTAPTSKNISNAEIPTLLMDFTRLREHVRSLYECSATALKGMLRDGGGGSFSTTSRSIKSQYKECFMLRLEFNSIRELVERLENDNRTVLSAEEGKQVSFENSSWNICGIEQLSSMASQLIAILNLYSVYSDARCDIMQHIPLDKQQQPFIPIQQALSLLTLETAVKNFGYFCLDSLSKLRMECSAWLFHHGVYTDWWDKFFPRVLDQYFSTNKFANQKNLDSAFILLSYLCNETVKYPRFQTKIIKQLIESVLTQLDNENELEMAAAPTQQSKTLLTWTLTLIASAFDVIISKRRQNDRWLFLTGDFGRNEGVVSDIAGQTNSGLQRGYAIKKKFGTAGMAGTSSNSIAGNSQQKIFIPVKSHYKKLTEQLEKMKQNESISQAKLDKLKNRLSQMQNLYEIFKHQENTTHTSEKGTLNEAIGTGQPHYYSQQSYKMRQYSLHLRLDKDLCIRVIKKLLSLLCHSSSATTQLQLQTQLIVFKVISKICVHGTFHPIPIAIAFEEHIKQILSLVLNDFDEPWMRHALLSMFLDISEAEIRSLAKEMLTHSLMSVAEQQQNSDKFETGKNDNESASTSPTQGHAKRRKEENTEDAAILSTDVTMIGPLESLSEEPIDRDEDSLMSIIAEENEQPHKFLDTLVDDTMSEAQLTAANIILPTPSSSQATTSKNSIVDSPYFNSTKYLIFKNRVEQLAKLVNIQPTAVEVVQHGEAIKTENLALKNCKLDELLQNTIHRNTFRRLVLLRTHQIPSSETLDNKSDISQEKSELLGHCMQATLNSIDELFSDLNNANNILTKIQPSFIERLLDFYWQYQSNLAAFLKSKSNVAVAKSGLFHAPPLSSAAALALISYAADNSYMTESGWGRILTILNISIAREPSLIDMMIASGKLFQLFKYFCFIGPAHSEFGPSLEKIFEHFVYLLITKSQTPALANLLAETLIVIYSKKSILTLSQFSLEAQLKISRVLAQCADKYMKQCDLDIFSRLYDTLIRYSNEYMKKTFDSDKTAQINHQMNKTSTGINMYNHYSNGQSFTTINAPPKNVVFGHPPKIDQLLSLRCDNTKATNQHVTDDPLELLAGPAFSSTEEMSVNNMFMCPSTSEHGKLSGAKKTTPKAFKGMHQTSKQQPVQMVLSAIDELPFPIIQANEEQMMDTVDNSSGPYFTTPAAQHLWTFPNQGIEYAALPVWTGVEPMSTAIYPRGKRAPNAPSIVIVHAEKTETILCNLMKTICLIIRGNPKFSLLLLEKQMNNQIDFLTNVLEFLSKCQLNRGVTLENISLEKWKLVTLGDTILYSLLITSKSLKDASYGAEHSHQFLQIFMEYIKASHDLNISSRQLSKQPLSISAEMTKIESKSAVETNMTAKQQQEALFSNRPMEISAVLAFVFIQFTKEHQNTQHFIKLGGHQFIAQQLQQSILAFTETANSAWPHGTSSFTEVQRQLRTIASQISGIDTMGRRIPQQQSLDNTAMNQGGSQFGQAAKMQIANPIHYTAGNAFASMPSSSIMGTAKKQICSKFGGLGETDAQQKPQLYNYAPNCLITSSSAMAHHLQMLLSASSHRRSRNPNWTYHFPAHQQWIDMTLTLPYPILLKEIVIKPHASSLINAPSAVQAELCSDPAGISWAPVQSPIQTSGCSRISIPTTGYKNPVKAVRLFFKKPIETSSLGLMQIQLNGSTQLIELQQQHTPTQQMIILQRWLTIFHQIVVKGEAIKVAHYEYSPKLTEQLVKLFLGNPAHPGDQIIQLLYQVLLDIDYSQSTEIYSIENEKMPRKSIVQHIIDHILTENMIHSEKMNIQLAELLFTFCTNPQCADDFINIKMIIATQRELLQGINALINQLLNYHSNETEITFKEQGQLNIEAKWGVLSILMWAAACALWQNAIPNSKTYKLTEALCAEIASNIIKPLSRLSLLDMPLPSSLSHSPFIEHVKKASRWLLCSLIHINPENLHQLFVFYGFDDDPIPANLSVFSAIGHVCQSKLAIKKLHNNYYLETWIQKAVQICEYNGKSRSDLQLLLAIVDCIEALSIMSSVCQLLEQSDDGPAFFRQLMNFLVDFQQQALALGINDLLNRLRISFINLTRRCLAYGGNHRSRISKYLCELLRNNNPVKTNKHYMPSGTLNDYLLQMLHRLVLDDEIIKVHFTDVIQLNARQEILIPIHEGSKRMVHPIFGCIMDDYMLETSLYTKCAELIPKGFRGNKSANQTLGADDAASTSLTKQSAADQWLKSHGFIPPPSTSTLVTGDDTTIAAGQKDCVVIDLEDSDGDWESWGMTAPPTTAYNLQMPKFGKKSNLASFTKDNDKRERIQFIHENTKTPLDEEQTLNEIFRNYCKEHKNGSDNEYMALKLSMRVVDSNFEISSNNAKSPITQMSENGKSTEQSSLEHFALAGGLYELSKHMHLYQQCLARLLNSCDNVTANLAERQHLAMDMGGKNTHVPHTSAYQSGIYDDIEFIDDNENFIPPMSGPATTDLTGGQPVSNFVVSIPTTIPMDLIEEMPPPIWQYDWTTMDQLESYSNGKRTRQDAVNYSTENVLYNSSHVITSLGLFLRLEKYAELFIRMDRPKAKRLIRMALDIRVTEPSVSARIDRLRPRSTHSNQIKNFDEETPKSQFTSIRHNYYLPKSTAFPPSTVGNAIKFASSIPPHHYSGELQNVKQVQPELEKESILMFPFIVLARLFNDFNPMEVGMDRAISIRQQALNLGIIDVLLEQFSHYAQQPARCILRSTPHSEPMVHLISQVLAAVNQLEHLWQEMGMAMQQNMDMQIYGSSGPGSMQTAQNVSSQSQTNQTNEGISITPGVKMHTAIANSTGSTGNNPLLTKATTATNATTSTGTSTAGPQAPLYNEGAYWAKGTGFGSGTTQQQWNLNKYVAKKRQNENNVACLLNILISYINPQPQITTQQQCQKDTIIESEPSSSSLEMMMPIFAATTDALANREPQHSEDMGVGSDEFIVEGEKTEVEEKQMIPLSEEFVELLYRSCLCSTVNSHLMNDSVLDISKRVFVFESVISMVSALAKTPSLHLSDPAKFGENVPTEIDVFDLLLLNGDKSNLASNQNQAKDELLSRLKNLSRNIEIYLSKLQTGQGKHSTASLTQTTSSSQQQPSHNKKRQRTAERKAWRHSVPVQSNLEEEELGKLLDLINLACAGISKKTAKHVETKENEDMDFEEQSSLDVAGPSKEVTNSLEPLYCQCLKELQFETIPFYEPNGTSLCVPFHYVASLNQVAQSAGMTGRIRRLAQEIVSLSTSLPLSASSSVFVRTSEERLDAMKVLITGPADTPYANGCFEFDVFFPSDYPNVPMLMNLETTGNKTVRFNPNLYDDGKVCLSILNTWRGRPEERWNVESSSLLQVLVSIQSLILVNEPYFNEPGYERWRNTPAGLQASREYDANICQMCVRWAMIEQIRHPPKAFAEVVRRHFWIKRDEICDQIESWQDTIQQYINSKAGTSKTLPSYLAGLKKQYEALKEEFTRMRCPEGLEHLHSIRFGCNSTSHAPNNDGKKSGVNAATEINVIEGNCNDQDEKKIEEKS